MPDDGVVFVFGLATFSYASADQARRRLAAVQLVTTKIADLSPAQVAYRMAARWRPNANC